MGAKVHHFTCNFSYNVDVYFLLLLNNMCIGREFKNGKKMEALGFHPPLKEAVKRFHAPGNCCLKSKYRKKAVYIVKVADP